MVTTPLHLWVVLALSLATSTCAFLSVSPSLHESDPSINGRNTIREQRRRYERKSQLQAATGNMVSGNVISELAVVAIKLCLADHTDVSCDLTASPRDVFQGKIGPVKVKGRDWKSSRGLSCRAIEASVDTCQLDFGAILSEQKLILTTPAQGKCMIAMTAQDFGNFLVHPRIENAKLKASQSAGLIQAATESAKQQSSSPSLIDFYQDNVVIDSKQGSVTFYAKCAGTKCKCVLKRAAPAQQSSTNPQQKQPTAIVEVTTLKSQDDSNSTNPKLPASRLAQVFTMFFNEMIFDLYDGLLLSYRDMKVTDDKGGKATPNILLALNIRVEKFPSPAVRPSDF
uniref:Uncharacterized protein n=1 Tax=Entomoneis paludosa TaxID=265537 RepID=A0A7S2YGP3_9STRA